MTKLTSITKQSNRILLQLVTVKA